MLSFQPDFVKAAGISTSAAPRPPGSDQELGAVLPNGVSSEGAVISGHTPDCLMLLHRFHMSRICSSILWSSRAVINLVDTFLLTLSTLSGITDLWPSPPLCGSTAAAE